VNAARCEEGGEGIVDEFSAIVGLNSLDRKIELCVDKGAELSDVSSYLGLVD
jgi:hypothetical protein